MRLTLINDFHGTRTTVETDRPLNPKRVRAIRKRLCGIDGCTCGNTLGVRGKVSDPDEYVEFYYRAERCVMTGHHE